MKLYYSPGACSLAPHIVLNELGAAYSLEKVDLGAKKTESGNDFLSVNGKGYVPTLEFAKDTVLTEVSTILQYLADKADATALLPKFGTMERYRAMETLNFIASELHKGLGGLFNKAMPEEGRKVIIDRLNIRLAWLDAQLGKHHYVSGSAFTVADAYAFTVLGWGKWVGVDMAKWPNITAYLARVAARPAVQKTLAEEGLAA
jgi:glutathione S-transferase